MPRIVTIRSKDDSNREVISLVLSQDAVTESPNGDPCAGVTLNSEQARSLARRLSKLAAELESREEDRFAFPRSSIPIASVVVVHDGSQPGHRAFATALHLARRSLVSIELIGIYGVSRHADPSVLREDYEWQKGWLMRLIELYAYQA